MNERMILLAVGMAGLVIFLLYALWKERRKNRQPTIQIRATITDVRLESRSLRGPYGQRNNIGHYVTFRTAEG